MHHPQRLTKPLIRKPGVPKTADFTVDPDDRVLDVFREATLGRGARRSPAAGCSASATRTGQASLAGFGSAKGSNEEAYLFQKLVRTGFGTQQRRPLHAPVPRVERRGAAGRHRLGRGVEPGEGRRRKAEVIFVIGANPTVEPSGRRDLDEERGARTAPS